MDELKPQIEIDSLLPASLSSDDIEKLADLADSDAWKILLTKVIFPRTNKVISEIVTSQSEDKEKIFRDVIFTRGQIVEHWIFSNVVKAAKLRKQDRESQKAEESAS